jgi:hypothetical protein
VTDRSNRPPAPDPDAGPSGSPTSGRSTNGSESHGPSGARRAGRRATQRPPAPEPSLLERRRGLLLGGLAVVVVALVGVFLFFGSTQKAYACTQLTTPAPAATPAPDSSTAPLGQAQDDMGRRHVDAGASVRYTYCPPASGSHYNAPEGPIPARYYGKDDAAVPQGWIHNLEHGGIVILYSCTVGTCDTATEDTLRQLVATFPPSPVCAIPPGGDSPAPVVARFDEMATPFAALVWGRLLLLDTLDTAKILAFYQAYGERTNPEPQCAAPSPSPGASTTP